MVWEGGVARLLPIPISQQIVVVVGMYIILKYLITAAVVVLVSEAAKRSDRLGAVIAALPLVTVLTLIWLYIERQPESKITNHAFYTFWYVIPTLPMFLLFPWAMPRYGFWETLVGCAVLTSLCFVLFSYILKRFGIVLM